MLMKKDTHTQHNKTHTQENSHLKVYQPTKKGKKEKEIKFIITHDMSAHNTEKREKMSFKFTNKKKEIIEKKRDNNKSFELGIGARMHALRIFIEKHKKKSCIIKKKQINKFPRVILKFY